MTKRIKLERVAVATPNTTGKSRTKWTRDDFAAALRAAHAKSVAAIIEKGRLLIAAKDQLDHGELGKMINEDLEWSWSTVNCLMAIARNRVLSKSEFIQNLPASWGTLFEMTKLPNEELMEMLSNGKLNSDTTRADVREILEDVRAEGLYIYEHLSQALATVGKFSRKWPNSSSILTETVLDEILEGESDLSLTDLERMPQWVTNLYSDVKREEKEMEEAWALDDEK